ncbi:hypothetical protein Brsp03_01682 [Brucella sp. NBRC 12951]|uniref:Rha family transcriptional regulator n=1 Tax=Brucella TaxID=234 RepID=UPI0015FA7F3B|nr:Rha family transcriptional regulator [Brucella anthropi]MBA8860156.1 Rha family phage regulatory protein [Brucella anthropi]QTN02746.1 hypothetical protein GTN27_06040 [Ochrobactrum sp. EEELCW01]
MTIHSTSITAAQPIVSVKDGKVFANSKDVADYFGKRHDNVLRDVDTLIGTASSTALSFEECPYRVSDGGRYYRAFKMTRDGFTLLAMGSTGKKALRSSFSTSKLSTSTAMKSAWSRLRTSLGS